MKRVYTAANLPEAALVADWLRAAGIEAHVLNQNAVSIAGDLPVDSALPQVWIGNALHEALAREVITRFQAPMQGAPLRCAACGEESPVTFAVCWKCGETL